MAQIFPSWTNRVPVLLGAGALALALVLPAAAWYFLSPSFTDVGYRPEQPVPFSHALHAGELGIDCRYCHAAAEVSPVASLPPTRTCLNCHRLVGRDAATLEPVRDSEAFGEPLHWVRVHDLPDYAHFDHSLHLRAGVGCSTCHGDVSRMEEVTQVEPLSMRWCLDCHRDPRPHLRPADRLTAADWTPGTGQVAFAERLIRERSLDAPTDCSGCHR